MINTAPEENLELIRDSVAFLVGEGKRVIYDAEHFFDGYRDDPEYALRCLLAALEAGAENVTMCDTNGSSLPAQVAEATARVVAEVGGERVGIHTHNDAECGVANSLAAVEQGASMVQGTMNGIGERCGNANLVSILPALQLKMGHRCVTDEQLSCLTQTAHLVDELCNMTPDPNQPYVGRNAFAHKGGMHVAGVRSDARTFEHLDPDVVGNRRELLVSELSGKGTVLARAEEAGLELTPERAMHAVERLKELEHRGYHFEAADASFDLFLRKESGALRAALPARELPRDHREARGRQGPDRGHDQGVGEGRAAGADRRGQRPRERARPGAAGRDRGPLSAPARHRARELQGPDHRRAQGHGRGHPRADRRLRQRRDVGHDRRLREHHRGELGGARRLARVRAAGPRARTEAAAPPVEQAPVTPPL